MTEQLSPKAYNSSETVVHAKLGSFEQYRPGYLELWAKAEVRKDAVTEAHHQVDAIYRGKDRLVAFSKSVNIPWFVPGTLLIREAGLRHGELDWGACLHNGERIIGTGRKTHLVPAGLGPFSTWEEAAINAIKREGLDKLDWTHEDWVAVVCWTAEKFNGFGYRAHGIPSPYLVGGTTVQRPGKFIRDGVYSYTTMDPQIGVMALLKVIVDREGSNRPSDVPAAHVYETLRVGSTGDDVRKVQEILGIKADGQFGEATKKAVADFQSKNGLYADGIVGVNTWAVINAPKTTLEIRETPPSPPVQPEDPTTKDSTVVNKIKSWFGGK